MDLEVTRTKGTKRQMSKSVQLLKSLAQCTQMLYYPPLVQECWIPRKYTVQVVPLVFFCAMSHILSGLPSVPLQCIIHAKNLISLCQLQRVAIGYKSERICSEKSFCFSLYNWRFRLSLINLVTRSRSQLFNLPALFN